MEWFNTNVSSTESTLEKTPEVLKAIGVNLPTDVSFRMVNDFMSEILFESFIGEQLIGIDRRILSNVLMNDLLQLVTFPALDNLSANLTATLQDANDHCFVGHTNFAFTFILVNVPSMSANESLIYFDPTFSAKLPRKGTLLQSNTNAVHHEPCRLLSNADGTMYFIGTHPILAIAEHPNSGKPLIQTERRILKDGSNLGRELTLGVHALALPLPLILEEHNILAATS